jgi:hypothetical protein
MTSEMVRRTEAPRVAVGIRARQRVDAQQIERVAVEDEPEGGIARARVAAQVVAEPGEVLVEEKVLERVVAAGLGVDAAAHVQIAQNDQLVHAAPGVPRAPYARPEAHRQVSARA